MTDAGVPRRVVVLRVRTLELIADGPSRIALLDLASAALGESTFALTSPPGHIETFDLPASFELNPFDENLIESLAEAVLHAADRADILVLDLMMDHTLVRYGAIEQLVYSAALKFAAHWPTESILVVLQNRVPHELDDIAQILYIEQLVDLVVFLDDKGGRLGQVEDAVHIEDRISTAAKNEPRDFLEVAHKRSLRRRGVFRVATSPREDYAAHKYSVEGSSLADVLRGYFVATGTTVALADSAPATWLYSAVHSAATPDDIATSAYRVSDLDEEDGEGDERQAELQAEVLAALKDPDARVCLVVPMVKNGERARQLLELLDDLGPSRVQILSIFVSDLDGAAVEHVADGWGRKTDVPFAAQPLHFLFDVTLDRLEADNWQVTMARLFREDLLDAEPEWTPSRTGLWAMLNERQAESGYTSGDHGVLMRMSLDRWDAGWLAASLIRKVRTQQEKSTEEMLLVMPDDEKTAIWAIGEALRTEQDAPVLRVPRELIHDESATIPPDLSDEIRRFRHATIILVDESTAHYGTLRGLARVVFKAAERKPDMSVVVLDLPEDGATAPTDMPLLSLYGWRPSTRKPLPTT